jgi:hypothetical protein
MLCVLSVLTSLSVRAQEPWDAISDQAALVVRVSSIDRATGNLNEMLAAIGPLAQMGGPALENGLGEMFHLAGKLDAMDRTAPALAALFPMPSEPESVAFVVRAKDEMKLRRAVIGASDGDKIDAEKRDDGFEKVTKGSTSWFFAKHGDWTVYTSNESVAKLMAPAAAKDHPFGKLLDSATRDVLARGDLAAVVNIARLTDTFKTEINQAREQVLQQIEQAPDADLIGAGVDPAVARDVLRSLVNGGFDAVFDARLAAGRVNFSADGAAAEGLLTVKPGSAAAGLLAAHPPSAFDTLGLLPAGAPAYYGVFANYGQIADLGGKLMEKLVKNNGELTKQMRESLDQLAKAGMGQLVAGFAFPADASSGMIVSMLVQAKDVAATRAAFHAYQQLGQAAPANPMFTQTTEYKEKAETYKNRSVDIQTTRFKFDAGENSDLAILNGFFKRIFGEDGLQTRITDLEGVLVEVTGNDPKYLARVVDGLESGEGVLGLSDAFAKTRDKLGKEANFIALFNVPQLIVDAVKAFRDIPPLDMVLGQLPFNFDATPAASFGGISIGTQPNGLRLHVYIPVSQPKGVLAIFGQ